MRSRVTVLLACAALLLAGPLSGQQGMGPRGKGKGPSGAGQRGNAAMQADRDLFHELLTHRAEIRRSVKPIDGGVETLTESDNPAVAAAIQKHVTSMKKRVEGANPIHLRDPLFAEVFRHADKITFAYEKTKQGVRVVETSDDPYVAKLIQAHAEVVSLFLKNGFDEVHQNHAIPAKP
jgi:uncharacterized protein